MGGEFLSRVVEKIVLKTFFIWLGFVADDDEKVMITAKRTKSDIHIRFYNHEDNNKGMNKLVDGLLNLLFHRVFRNE